MKRIAITNMPGTWFDLEKAEKFKESTYHNGSNHISKATGSQWNHEVIYLTMSGKWVLNRWSNYQGTAETHEIISEYEAVVWFLRQEMDLPKALTGKDQDYEI